MKSRNKNSILAERKNHHLEMAMSSIITKVQKDQRFNYEPLLSSHPSKINPTLPQQFLGKMVNAPIWISSMTGGSSKANQVNKTLAKVAFKLKIGMGLGSCRPLLEEPERLDDFNLRPILGNELPLMANIGVAQLDEIIQSTELQQRWKNVLNDLDVDGVFVHVNPLQEWLQPEGDQFSRSSLEIIKDYIEIESKPVLVKEVGQGFGPQSLIELDKLDIAGVELAGFGGTNFSKLESMRSDKEVSPLSFIGHTPLEMIEVINEHQLFNNKEIIISGGITNFLDAHYLQKNLNAPSHIGMAGQILLKASEGEEELTNFLNEQILGLSFCRSFLHLRDQS